MRKMGFLISPKKNEKRRVILPHHLANVENVDNLYFEKGYGKVLGVSDEEYLMVGSHVVDKDDILKKDIICDAKIGDSDYIKYLNKHQIIFGWIHAVQNINLTNILIQNKNKCIAWEDMYDSGRHVFWRNNEIAGEAAVVQAFQYYGKFPYETKVAILGRGNTARGAYRILNGLGANITVYNSRQEDLFRREMSMYDVIVNAILWDTTRCDHIIYRRDLSRLKKGALIIDVSCDCNKGIETSKTTTINEPVYYVDGILHYVVDHTPSLFYKTASNSIGNEIARYIDVLVQGKENSNEVLSNAIIIYNGQILDRKIIQHQNRGNDSENIA